MTDNRQLFINSQIVSRFGKVNSDKFFSLIERLKKHDEAIENNINAHLENILQLSKERFEELLPFLEELSKTSNFASSFFIEKIPTLLSSELYDEMMSLLLDIKDYNARNLSYILGSSSLETDDLDDILLEVDLGYYRKLVTLIRANRSRLQAVSASMLIHSKGISKTVNQKSLPIYIKVCIAIYEKFGFDIADLYIKKTKEVLRFVNLKDTFGTFKKISEYSAGYLEFFLNYPQASISTAKTANNLTKTQILNLINKDILLIPKKAPNILKNKYLVSILVNWKSFSSFQKKNMLLQLSRENYYDYLMKNKNVKSEVGKINKSTNYMWFKEWQYPQIEIDEKYIYTEIKKTIFSGKNYNTNTELMYQDIKETMNKYKNKKKALLIILSFLEKNVNNEDTNALLKKLKKLLVNRDSKEKIDFLSSGKLLVLTWARDPWIDYSRSDELYACTNIGDYASYNSPSFLADLNISNLDIWSNGERRGRIYLYLVNDLNNELYILVDRINGSDRLIRHKNQLDTLFIIIKEYATVIGIEKVFFNSAISFNNTPKQFVDYITSRFGEESYLHVKRYIFEGAIKKTLLHTKNSFLEALGYKEAGVIKGVLLNLD